MNPLLYLRTAKRNITLFVTSLFLFLNAFPVSAQVVFSEIMFDVPGSDYNDEFIEIYNLSDTAVDLSGWQFSDSSSSDFLADAGMGLILSPKQYAVILDGSYFDNSATYDEIIPDSALVIKIDDNAFGSNGLSNSQSERLSLMNAQGKTVQIYYHSLDNEPGYSDEKILLSGDNSPANWENSLLLNGTPGFRNSVAPFEYDLCLKKDALRYFPSSSVYCEQNIEIELKLSNCGLRRFDDHISLALWLDVKNDSIMDAGEAVIFEQQLSPSLCADSDTLFRIDWQAQQAGRFKLCAKISADLDGNELNNFVQLELIVLESKETVIINEIKYLTEENEEQWLEVYNSGEKSINLLNWAFADLKDTVVIDSSIFVHPHQFKVFASDSGLCTLYHIPDSLICVLDDLPYFNKSSDIVYLLNPAGGWVEQVPYEQSWMEGEEWKKPSLERIHPKLDSRLSRNWGPCAAEKKATPGVKNSIYATIKPDDLKVYISPNPFSPDGDGYEDHAIISIHSPASTARARLEIYDILGRKVRTLLNNEFIGSRFDVVWDGRFANGRKVRMGIYIVYIQILNDRDGLLREYKETVVVAGKL